MLHIYHLVATEIFTSIPRIFLSHVMLSITGSAMSIETIEISLLPNCAAACNALSFQTYNESL